MTAQVAVNSKALINLAAKLEQLGYTRDDVHDVAERLADGLLDDGYRRIEAPPPLRPAHVATPEQQKAHVAHARQMMAAVRDGKRGTT